MPKVAIIGAGLAGLTCAHYLRNAGIQFKIFEKNSVPGGRIKDVPIENTSMSVGGVAFTEDYTVLRELLNEYDLLKNEFPTNYKDTAVYLDGHFIKFTPTSIIFTRHFSFVTKIQLYRLFKFLKGLKGEEMPKEWDLVLLKDFIEDRFSSKILDVFIEPGMRTIVAQSSEDVAASYALRPIAAFFTERLLKGGLTPLVHKMVAEMSDSVSLGSPVEEVRSKDSGGFTLRINRGKEDFDTVICSLPIPKAKEILPELPDLDLGYSDRRILIMKGKRKFNLANAIINADWKKHNVYAVRARGDYTSASVGKGNYDLTPFIEDFSIIHEEYWEHCGPIMPQDVKVPRLMTAIPNLYLCGDFYLGGGLESAARSGKEVATMITS